MQKIQQLCTEPAPKRTLPHGTVAMLAKMTPSSHLRALLEAPDDSEDDSKDCRSDEYASSAKATGWTSRVGPRLALQTHAVYSRDEGEESTRSNRSAESPSSATESKIRHEKPRP